MNARNLILGVVLVFIVALGLATLKVAVTQGPDILTVLSVLVLALFGFGIVGALRHPPD
jgi:hypothetical protein